MSEQMDHAALARKNLDRRLAPLREINLAAPSRGWLRAMRDALGMTTRQMAKRLHVVPSRIIALEKAEAQGAVTLRSLREAAEAMDCALVYAIVPMRSLEVTLRDRAAEQADKEIRRLDHTMKLENQALGLDDLAAARVSKIEELMAGSPRRLWDDA